MTITSTDLRERLTLARPHLTPILTLLTDLQLTQLTTAIIDDQQALLVKREQYLAYSRELNANAAGTHGAAKHIRTTSSGKLAIAKVQHRVSRKMATKDQLRIGELELERALDNLTVD
jgi:hypothetical protein